MKEAFIYKVVNKINGKSYIGQTIDTPEKRWIGHCNKNSNCKFLKHAIQKYGKKEFLVTILETLVYEDKAEVKIRLNALEKELIEKHKTLAPNGYNLLPGGKSPRGKLWGITPKKGRKWTEEHRAKYIATKTGMKYGPRTQAQKDKQIEICNKPIICNETGQVWPSVRACAEHFNVKSKQISRVLKGQRKRLKWQYTFSYLPKTYKPTT